MYELLARSHDNILGYLVEGKITDDEYHQLTTEVEAAIGKHGKVRLLVVARGFPTAAISTLGDRLSFARDHFNDIDRFAVVTDHKGLELLTKAADKVTSLHLRQFGHDDQEAAWAWVEAP